MAQVLRSEPYGVISRRGAPLSSPARLLLEELRAS
jgi:hypothetical protein